MSNFQIEKVGRRYYIVGNTYPIKDQLGVLKCTWDRDRKEWWTGKKDVADQIASGVSKPSSGESITTQDQVIIGRATYKGKTYYLLAEGVSSKTGKPYAKLAFRDGSRVFWASDMDQFQLLRRYREPTSIDSLRAYADRKRSDKTECPECARHCRCDTGFCQHHHDGCDRCGAEK